MPQVVGMLLGVFCWLWEYLFKRKWAWYIIKIICIVFDLYLTVIKNDNIIKDEKGGVK